jgi:hypothetical protein
MTEFVLGQWLAEVRSAVTTCTHFAYWVRLLERMKHIVPVMTVSAQSITTNANALMRPVYFCTSPMVGCRDLRLRESGCAVLRH